MNILFVITKAELGGAQRFVLDLAGYLQSQGHTVTVGYGEPGFLTEALSKQQIATHRFTNLKRGLNPFGAFRFQRELREFIRRNAFDVVHFNSSNTLLGIFGLNKLSKPPTTVATMHGLSFIAPEHKTLLKPFYTLIYQAILKKFNHVIYISNRDQKNAEHAGLPSGTVIPLGIPEESFLPQSEARHSLAFLDARLKPESFIIGAIGRLAYPKNIAFLVKNFHLIQKLIPHAQLLIIGDGPDREQLLKYIKELGLAQEIILLGSIPQAAHYLKALNLLVVPSTYEGVPYVVLEALQARIPLLLSAVGGMPEIVPPDFLFTLTGEDFKKQLTALKKNNFPLPPLLQERTLERMAQEYLHIYQSFL